MAQEHVRVLLVEDSHVDRRLVSEWLSEQAQVAFDVESRDSLAAAMARLAQVDIDVILLDLNLPDSRGMPTCTKLLERFPECPIVVLSGLDDRRTAIEAVQAGAQDYLVKGEVDEKTLPRTLCYAIERHRWPDVAANRPAAAGNDLPAAPCLDPQLRELRLGRVLVKRLRQRSPNQERILSPFEEEGWPRRIDDPLPPDPRYDPKERLHTTLKSLNRTQQHPLIRFHGDGTGQGIVWEPVEETESP